MKPKRKQKNHSFLFGISGGLPLCSAFLLLFIGGALLGAPLATQGAPVNFVITGSLAMARFEHTETLLPNGKVLVAGGNDDTGDLASAELYDPASGTWTATGSLATARGGHTATLLPTARCSSQEDLTPATLRARNCTIRRANLECDRQPRYRAGFSHGNIAS